MKIVERFVACVLLLFASACSITRVVEPIPAGTRIDTLHVQHNEDVFMEGFLSELTSQIEAQGVRVETYSGPTPTEARFHLEYTANWNWDLGMYLVYFRAQVFEGAQVIGSAEYDASSGGGNMGKFGATKEKIRPLITELFGGAPADD